MNEWMPYFFTMKKFKNFEEDFLFSLPHTDLLNSKFFTFALKKFILYEDANACFICCFQCLQFKKSLNKLRPMPKINYVLLENMYYFFKIWH